MRKIIVCALGSVGIWLSRVEVNQWVNAAQAHPIENIRGDNYKVSGVVFRPVIFMPYKTQNRPIRIPLDRLFATVGYLLNSFNCKNLCRNLL